jgi:hypothetical protein
MALLRADNGRGHEDHEKLGIIPVSPSIHQVPFELFCELVCELFPARISGPWAQWRFRAA